MIISGLPERLPITASEESIEAYKTECMPPNPNHPAFRTIATHTSN